MNVTGKAFIYILACGLLHVTLAGRAFPVASENFAVRHFRKIGNNPSLVWDPTNFLVDLSGFYAQCKRAGQRGYVGIKRKTPQKQTIGALVDTTNGDKADVQSVNGYIRQALETWSSNRVFINQIAMAKKFGCSVQPGCKGGRVSISCLFSPGENNEQKQEKGKQKALAFTKTQYKDAEKITNTRWDYSNYIENLSGYETDCAMIYRKHWTFAKAIAAGKKKGWKLIGLYGSSANKGSTPPAIKRILRSWKKVSAIKVGCSVIPDCKTRRGLVVVVSCLFREK